MKDRRYLDRTGLEMQRSIGDLMRYSALNQGGDSLASYAGFIPIDAPTYRRLPSPERLSRYSDEQRYALTRYIYSLEPPPNPNRFDAVAARGKQVFEDEGCATCHRPPLYTNNRLTPALGFTVPDDHREKFDIMSRSVGTDPELALRTRRGTGYYKVPSLKGVWYRGMFGHSGWAATLEDWFDPRRVRDDYVPTGCRSRGRDGRGNQLASHGRWTHPRRLSPIVGAERQQIIMTLPIAHKTVELDGIRTFYREAGPADAPVVLLPHGYPCSSYQFRRFMPALADRWRLLAPDFPGCGYSDTPENFRYDFDGYTDFLDRFVRELRIGRYALYLHDFGSQIGLRLAMRAPGRVAALIIQNGDIYEDELGPRYAELKAYWEDPTPERRERLGEAVSEDGFRDEFLNDVRPELAERIPPDLWKLHWSLMTPQRREIAVSVIAGLRENRNWFPRYQAYLRTHRPPTLIAWGPQDGYMPEGAARAYLRDLPDAELHLLDGGHWALETNLEELVLLVRRFLDRVHR